MSSVSLLITGKWRSRPPILIVPGHGIVTRPGLGRLLVTSHQYVATWLINNGYCTLLEPKKPPEPDPKAVETIVDRQVYIDENSNLQLIPPLESLRTEPDIPIEKARLINFFMTADAVEINSAIPAVSLKKAQELKQLEILEWSDVVKILTERAIEAAIKWVQSQA